MLIYRVLLDKIKSLILKSCFVTTARHLIYSGTQNVRREKHVSAVYTHTHAVEIKDGCGSIIFGSGSILRFVSIPQRTLALGLSVLIYV